MNEKELLQIIEQAAKEGVTSLDFSGQELTTLPPEIGQLTNLTGLYLNKNQLTALPPEIGQLINLTGLYLNKNQLTALTPEIGQLKNLAHLSLGRNQLTVLPLLTVLQEHCRNLWTPSPVQMNVGGVYLMHSPAFCRCLTLSSLVISSRLKQRFLRHCR